MHGLRTDILREIEAKQGQGRFPILSALCADASLQKKCTCEAFNTQAQRTAEEKRLSYAAASPSRHGNRLLPQQHLPGTAMRPLSWHSEHFNPNDLAAMQLYNAPISAQQQYHHII